MGICISKVKETVPRTDEEDEEFPHRLSPQLSLSHLVRHHRVHPFTKADRFGFNGSFEVVKMLGRGGTGETWLCKDMAAGGKLVAVKLQQRPIPKSTANLTYNEIMVQASASEGCIFLTCIREVLLSPSHLGLSLEFEAGGTLAEYVSNRITSVGKLDLATTEDEARYFFRQLIAAVYNLHRHHIAHRDIKLDNTLLDGKDPPTLKLADFQFAYYWGSGDHMKSTHANLGTPVYMAPEILETFVHESDKDGSYHNYDPVQADVWACSIWLLAMLVGAFPFDHDPGVDTMTSEKQVWNQQMGHSWRETRFVKPYIDKISESCASLLDSMLAIDPAQRMSLAAVQMHPWVTTPLPPALEAAWSQLQEDQAATAARVGSFRANGEVEKARNLAVMEAIDDATKSAGAELGSHHSDPDNLLYGILDRESIPQGLKINMRQSAVAQEQEDMAQSATTGSPSDRVSESNLVTRSENNTDFKNHSLS